MPKLVVKTKNAVKELPLEGPVTLGRASKNDVQLLEEKASRMHARIFPSGKQFVIEDLNSANGTFLNGQRITRAVLRSGDVVTIGEASLEFQSDAAEDLVGKTIAANYRVVELIGKGGMGAVYKAIQLRMDRPVALKVLKPSLTASRDFLKGFLQEARTAGHLDHPAIIRVYEVGESEGICFFSMEFIEGRTAQQILNEEGALPLSRALEVIIPVTEALAYAAERGVVHQDVKPQNIIIDRFGQVKLADLGLAAIIRGKTGLKRKQFAGPAGTPHYMAPEQVQGEPVDVRTDIYALGCTFFHLITGQTPFGGRNSLSILTKHLTAARPSPREFNVTIPPSVCRLIQRMMAVKPADRFPEAAALLQELRAIQESEARALTAAAQRVESSPGKIKKRPTTAPSGPPRLRRTGGQRRRRGFGLGATLGLLAVFLLATVVVWRFVNPHRKTGLSPDADAAPTETTSAPSPPGWPATRATLKEVAFPAASSRDAPSAASSPAGDPAADQESWRRATLEALERARQQNNLPRIRQAAEKFLARYPQAPAGDQVRRARDAALDSVQKTCQLIYTQAVQAAERGDYGHALSLCGRLSVCDRGGEWERKARQLAAANDQKTKPRYEQVRADIDRALRGHLYDVALDRASRGKRELTGTAWESQLTEQLHILGAANTLTERIEQARQHKKRQGQGIFIPLAEGGGALAELQEVKEGNLKFRRVRDNEDFSLALGQQNLMEITALLQAAEISDAALGVGAALLLADRKTEARRFLEQAINHPACAADAVLMLRRLGGAKNLVLFDFDRLDDQLQWTPADGEWSLEDGTLVCSGSGETTLKDKLYSAAGFSAAVACKMTDLAAPEAGFTLELSRGINDALVLQVLSDRMRLLVLLGGAQQEGNVALAKVAGRPLLLRLAAKADTITAQVDGQPIQQNLPGLGALSGRISLKLHGCKVAIDQVLLRDE